MPNRGPVLAIGECLIDLIAVEAGDLTTASTLAIREGGAPMNVAVGLARMGTTSAFCGVIGADPFGERLRRILDANGVNTAHLHATPQAETSVAYAWRDERGDGHFRLLRQADCRLTATWTTAAIADLQPAAVIAGSVAIATPISKLAVQAAIRAATAQGIPVVTDLNIRISQWASVERLRRVLPLLLRDATLIKLSVDDAREAWGLTEPIAIRCHIARWSDAQLVITDGSRGVTLFHPGSQEPRAFPVFPVEAVEPTGAGDAFLAGIVTRLLKNGWRSLDEADIRFAMAAGALATAKAGALAALPTRTDIEAFLKGESK